jgi:hypothetical protein
MRRPEDGDLEPVTEADYLELEKDRARAAATVADRREKVGQTGPPPVQDQREPGPAPPEFPADMPRYKPGAFEVDFGPGPVRLRLHPARLDLAAADRAGREHARQLLEKARQDFLAGEPWAEVLRLRARLAEVDKKKADVRLTLEAAKDQHRKAAAEGQADAAKLYKKVLEARNEWNGHAVASVAVTGQLKALETRALEDLARRTGEARRAAAEEIAGSRLRLREELLAALKPILEALHKENAAGGELAQLTRAPPRLPA